MTRENKLALIIGFGLILVVGILVSDHFSAASIDETADLSDGTNSLIASHLEDENLLNPINFPVESSEETTTGLRAGPMLHNGAEAGLANNQQQSVKDNSEAASATPSLLEIRNPDLQKIQPVPDIQSEMRWYSIKPNESLAGIAKRVYGDERLWRRLAEINSDRISNPDVVHSGITIRLPEPEDLLGEAAREMISQQSNTKPTPVTDKKNTPKKFTYYVVQDGDVLSKLSRKFLGTSKRWRELYEFNQDVIKNPDNIRAGIRIRIPTN